MFNVTKAPENRVSKQNNAAWRPVYVFICFSSAPFICLVLRLIFTQHFRYVVVSHSGCNLSPYFLLYSPQCLASVASCKKEQNWCCAVKNKTKKPTNNVPDHLTGQGQKSMCPPGCHVSITADRS